MPTSSTTVKKIVLEWYIERSGEFILNKPSSPHEEYKKLLDAYYFIKSSYPQVNERQMAVDRVYNNILAKAKEKQS